MRRKDREITEKKQIEDFIAKEQIIRIGFYDEGDIYMVPVNYGYICNNGRYTFFFHGAKAGRKYELTKSEPKVGFEIDGKYELTSGDIACEYSCKFQSVIGSGKLTLIEDASEKVIGLNAIMRQTTGRNNWDYEDSMLEEVAVFKLEVEKLTCKGK